jgi:hypothetical protein
MLDELAVWWITGDGQNDHEEVIQHLRSTTPDDLADAFDRLKRSWFTEYRYAPR